MESISLTNFRCFRGEQKARLAPLTLLVGENSTGKTSFMAMIRALWEVALEHRVPDFKEAPYDLGSFDDIVHDRGRRGGRAENFEAGFEVESEAAPRKGRTSGSNRFSVVFGKRGAAPVPVRRRFESGACWVEERLTESGDREIRVGTPRGSWRHEIRIRPEIPGGRPTDDPARFIMYLPYFLWRLYVLNDREGGDTKLVPLNDSPDITRNDLREVEASFAELAYPSRGGPHASAPVRSRPRRTYDPARAVSDPEGDYIPMYLANMHLQDKRGWTSLKQELETFGRAAGLFDEIEIKRLGKQESAPFQLRIRKFGGRLKGPPRNMKDVGYGVSQVLPVVTELLRRSGPSMFLLQQPEVHLHPRAQAALGSLFGRIAGSDRQLVVETHSDHLLDRVRMDVRDGKGKPAPEDVSILYFERGDLDVRIHSLRLDAMGNVLGAPDGYRAFFMEEMRRSLGF